MNSDSSEPRNEQNSDRARRFDWKTLGWGAAVSFLGLTLIVASGLSRTHEWTSALLLNLGAAVFLAVPLLAVTRVLTGKIKESEATFTARIEQVKADTDEKINRLAATLDARSTVLGWSTEDPDAEDLSTMEQICNLLHSGITSKHGFIVPFIKSRSIFVSIAAAGDHQLQVTPLDARQISGHNTSPKVNDLAPVSVSRDGSLNDLAAGALKSIGDAFPTAERLFNPIEFEDTLRSHIQALAALYQANHEDDSEGFRMIVNDQWALADDVLFPRRPGSLVELKQSTAGEQGWRPFMLGKSWVDPHQLDEGFRWAYGLGLTTAAAVEGDVAYSDDRWHASARLTD
ncbi:hypothetical protein ABLE94_02515 [Gordonia sp. VNK1]|uniref:hypothetical protein n=1 Tax=Gordonia oleivorans TaxID=3156618 RepID=UPI0032B4C0F6